ncbi:MAG TPA: hypothetical protein VFU37_09015, partial [Pyrinomonadaceae bacterium]|nr:hypothetical protein [Pyrinomonadaceae bacterium]
MPRIIQRLASLKFVRETVNFAGFVVVTAVMTWPWVRQLRDACADPGDPYLVSWILWWDYHQTFTAPLHLFDANIFYPLKQTLAFSENDYGISLLFFPLFALGFQPLTVNSVATFLSFAFCGYGAFRLTRTLTDSTGAAWVSGFVFAFIPYRFHLLSQLHYVFSGWLPLTFEAIVLFARERSPRRAAWLGIAFTMNALTCLSWFVLSLVPLVLSLVFLIIRYRLLSDRKFWIRGSLAAAASMLALLPFLWPYLHVSKAYGFNWGPEALARNSPSVTRWLVAEYRNVLWKGFGDNFSGYGPKLFTGLLTPLLALAAIFLPTAWRPFSFENPASQDGPQAAGKWVVGLNALAVVAAIFVVLSLGWKGSTAHPALGRFFAGPTVYRSLFVFAAAVLIRLAIAYPKFLRRITQSKNLIAHIRRSRHREPVWLRAIWLLTSLVIWSAILGAVLAVLWGWTSFGLQALSGSVFDAAKLDTLLLILMVAIVIRFSLAYPALLRRATGAKNLIEHIRQSRDGEVLWLGIIWTVTGFLMSLGTNSWFYRVLYNLVFLFHSMREPSRAAMMADLGLAVLAGVGAMKLAHTMTHGRAYFPPAVAVSLIALALLFELRAAPLRLYRGAVYPDQITLRLKETNMRGGLVELPAGNGVLPHLYMLRAADHQKPLINAISTFIPPHAWEIERLSQAKPISLKLLDAMEKVPASYLVIHNALIEPERRSIFETFLATGVSNGRLRFVNRFDAGDDLYAVVKTEPAVKSEAPLPFQPEIHEWSAMIREDQTKILFPSPSRIQSLYRLYLASTGKLPRYMEFMKDSETLTHGLIMEASDDEAFENNLRHFVDGWMVRAPFKILFGDLDDSQYIDRLAENAGIKFEPQERANLIDELSGLRETRAGALFKIVYDRRFIDKENARALVLLHYFAYLHRNPGDPPDRDLSGFNFWIQDFAKQPEPARLSFAFQS